ncbi:hypothetical protein [uncultured Nitratireductor sp.]|uniref:hypothetical protein n=1 Tax=uncultured Nitratireductor sp. TaxID=520953 RepID=UPI00261812C1|nr:hypothetical protein [uncultured Nitratireductor sp.]
MLTLEDIIANISDQDKGREFELVDPVDGKPTGIKFRVAGPDSETQRRSRLALTDELAEMADDRGRVTAEQRERARINSLARCVLGWTIEEYGKPIPFNHKNVVRVLMAGTWIQQQVDAFASDRAAFREVA